MSFGIVVLSHTCTLTPHQGADPDHTSCNWRVIQHPYNCNMHKVQSTLSCHKLHVGMYVHGCIPLQLLYYNRKSTIKECGEENNV